jgi:type 2A phosphatase activator TIP41
MIPEGEPSDASAVRLTWNALDALAEVAVGEGWEERVGGGVQVAMAEKWSKGR